LPHHLHHHFAQPSILDKHITMWYNIGIVGIYITLPQNLTFVRNDNKVVHRRVQMTNEYKQGYEDACKDTAQVAGQDSNLTTVSFSF